MIKKQRVTAIAFGSSDIYTYRLCLEACNYEVRTIWTGSKEELLYTFSDASATDEIIIIDAHGDEKKGFVGEDETVTFAEIAASKGLEGKIVVSTSCYSGTEEFIRSFNSAEIKSYVAPVDGVTGPSSIIFITNLFYQLNKTAFYPESDSSSWEEALKKAVKLSEGDWVVV